MTQIRVSITWPIFIQLIFHLCREIVIHKPTKLLGFKQTRHSEGRQVGTNALPF